MTLDDLDRSFAAAPYPHLVREIGLSPGGVDPLGLRQVNLNLMDAALPGINNVTRHIRPYAFMCWAWWKAAREAEARGIPAVAVADLQDIVDRLEVMFVWSHFLAEDDEGLPGRLVVNDRLPRRGSTRGYEFHGEAWARFRSERRASTSIMAPIQYGPSIRALGWLIQVDGHALRPSLEAMPAVMALDRRISDLIPPAFLDPDPLSVGPDRMETLHSAWAIGRPDTTERATFRNLFHDMGENAPPDSRLGRRRRTLDLILAVLQHAEKGIGIADIRRAMASGRSEAGAPLELSEASNAAHLHWAALQARQLQRLALESLLRWIETRIDEGRSRSDELATDADEAARKIEQGADALNVGSYLDHAAGRANGEGWPNACGVGGETDIFRLMDDLAGAQAEDGCRRVPGLALRAIAYSNAMTIALSRTGVLAGLLGPLGGEVDRLPLSVAGSRLMTARGRSLRSLWTEIIDAWVIGQHVRWSVARNGDKTQRLRVALGDRGWARLWKGPPSGPFAPTADRLWTALSLAAECGMIERRTASAEEVYFAA